MEDLCHFNYQYLNHKLFGPVRAGWLLPKNSMLKPILNRFLVKAHESGLYNGLTQKYFINPKTFCMNKQKGENGLKKIDFESAKYIFFVLIGGASMGVILTAFEFCYAKLRPAVDKSNSNPLQT